MQDIRIHILGDISYSSHKILIFAEQKYMEPQAIEILYLKSTCVTKRLKLQQKSWQKYFSFYLTIFNVTDFSDWFSSCNWQHTVLEVIWEVQESFAAIRCCSFIITGAVLKHELNYSQGNIKNHQSGIL